MPLFLHPDTGEMYAVPLREEDIATFQGALRAFLGEDTLYAPPPFETVWAGKATSFIPRLLMSKHLARRGGAAIRLTRLYGYIYDLSADQNDTPKDDWGRRFNNR